MNTLPGFPRVVGLKMLLLRFPSQQNITRFLDAMHTGLMWGGLWNMLIGYFGQAEHIEFLPWCVYPFELGVIVNTMHSGLSQYVHLVGYQFCELIFPSVYRGGDS